MCEGARDQERERERERERNTQRERERWRSGDQERKGERGKDRWGAGGGTSVIRHPECAGQVIMCDDAQAGDVGGGVPVYGGGVVGVGNV